MGEFFFRKFSGEGLRKLSSMVIEVRRSSAAGFIYSPDHGGNSEAYGVRSRQELRLLHSAVTEAFLLAQIISRYIESAHTFQFMQFPISISISNGIIKWNLRQPWNVRRLIFSVTYAQSNVDLRSPPSRTRTTHMNWAHATPPDSNLLCYTRVQRPTGTGSMWDHLYNQTHWNQFDNNWI